MAWSSLHRFTPKGVSPLSELFRTSLSYFSVMGGLVASSNEKADITALMGLLRRLDAPEYAITEQYPELGNFNGIAR